MLSYIYSKKLFTLKVIQPIYMDAYNTLKELNNTLKLKDVKDIPKLTRVSLDNSATQNSYLPLIKNNDLIMPVYNLANNFLLKSVTLPKQLFNVPPRGDLVLNLHRYESLKGKITTHIVKRVHEVSGAGKKPFPQKGRGKARVGSIRSVGRRKGGKAHGRRMRNLEINYNQKNQLQAISCLFSMKLADGGIKIIDSEALETLKTKEVNKKFSNWNPQERKSFILPNNNCKNFELATRNIDNIKIFNIKNFTVNDILKADKVIFTLASLEEFCKYYLARYVLKFKPKAFEPEDLESYLIETGLKKVKRDELKDVKYDPTKPFELNFEILKDYYENYKLNKTKENSNN